MIANADMGNRSQRHVLHGTSEHQQRGKIEKAVGMSFGGRNTKVHTMGDTLSNSVVSMLSYDNDHDALHTVFFLRQTEIEGNSVISDKAYGSQALKGARLPFPPTARRKP